MLLLYFSISAAGSTENDTIKDKYDTVDVYGAKSTKPHSVLFESYPDSTYPTIIEEDSVSDTQKLDTLVLPEITAKISKQDSISESFKKYWTRVEKEEEIDKLREQLRARDIDHSWVPHWYFFDSTLVIMPFPVPFLFSEAKNKSSVLGK